MEEGKPLRSDRRTLSIVVLTAFIGKTVTVELKRDFVLAGILDNVDKDMNLTIGRATGYYCEGPRRGTELPFSELVFVRGRNIRFVGLDESTSINEQLRQSALQRKRGTKSRHWISDKKRTKVSSTDDV